MGSIVSTMSALRLVCHVSAPSGEDFPEEADDGHSHPFWEELEELADAIAESARERGLDPDALGYSSESEDGTLLVQSSDAPRDVVYFWIWLPHEEAVQATLLPLILERLARMRDALPEAHWEVKLGEEPLHWDGGRFHLTS
jgi:hypothetical protein